MSGPLTQTHLIDLSSRLNIMAPQLGTPPSSSSTASYIPPHRRVVREQDQSSEVMVAALRRRADFSGGGIPQQHFRFEGVHCMERKAENITFLQQSIRLARSIAQCPRSMTVIEGMLQVLAAEPVPSGVRANQLQPHDVKHSGSFIEAINAEFSGQNMSIVLVEGMSDGAYVAAATPKKIKILYEVCPTFKRPTVILLNQSQLVQAGGRCLQQDPYHHDAYPPHCSHLAIIIAHEIQHCLRECIVS